MNLDNTSKEILKKIAEIDGPTQGAYNIRMDGGLAGRQSTKNIQIKAREDGKPGIDIFVKPGTKGEDVHIPVLVTKSGMDDMVYNDFFIGEGADVKIIAGCAIHNCGKNTSGHNGIHTFHVGKNATLIYTEKHYGSGYGSGQKILNPTTVMHLEEGAACTTVLVQIEGVTSTHRDTVAHLAKNAKLNIEERLLTHDEQSAVSKMEITLNGDGAAARIVSRSVAKDNSRQEFYPIAIGKADCRAHVQCDAIIMGNAIVKAVPAIEATCKDAQIVHEAAIGRINNDQMVKLETLGLSEEEAEQEIINAFLE